MGLFRPYDEGLNARPMVVRPYDEGLIARPGG